MIRLAEGRIARSLRSTIQVGKCSSPYLQLVVGGSGSGVVSQAGAALLLRTAESVGLITTLSRVLSPWRKPLAVHDPGKIVLDLAVAVALGGDCLADIGLARVEPGVFGLVASDPTVSRLITALAEDPRKAVTAIRAARAAARAARTGSCSPPAAGRSRPMSPGSSRRASTPATR
jgi:hypothetical protein